MFLGWIYEYVFAVVISALALLYNVYCFIGLLFCKKNPESITGKFNIYVWISKKLAGKSSNNEKKIKRWNKILRKINVIVSAILAIILIANIVLLSIIYLLNIQATNISNILTTLFGDSDCVCYAKCTGNEEDDSKTAYELLFGEQEYKKLYNSITLMPSEKQPFLDMLDAGASGKEQGEWLIKHLDDNAVQCYKEIVGDNNKFRAGDHQDRSEMTNGELKDDLVALLKDYKVGGRNPECSRCFNIEDSKLDVKCIGEAHWVPGWTWEVIWDSDNPGDGSVTDPGSGGGGLLTNAQVEEALRNNGYSGKASILAAAYQACINRGWGEDFAIGLMANIQHEGKPGIVEGINFQKAFDKGSLPASRKAVLTCGCSKSGTVTLDYWANSGVPCGAHELAATILNSKDGVNSMLSIANGVSGIGVGSIQWSGGRRAGILQRYLNSDMSEGALANCDLEYILDELSGGYANVVSACSGKSAEDCAQIIHDQYEKSGDANAVTTRRATAQKIKAILSSIPASGGGSSSSGGSNMTAGTQEVINMDDTTFWKFISNNRFSSYQEASAAYKQNQANEKAFWTGQVTHVTVPCWKWKNGYSEKTAATCTIQVNKALVPFFTDFMTDLYNLPEKYVIVSVGGFSPRLKNNGSSNPGLSAHTFGSTLDINAYVKGMGSVPVKGPETGVPFRSSAGLSEPEKSQCCTLDNSWFDLAKRYELNWGGLWSYASQDPMHFSIVGDGAKKRQVNYNPRGQYR